MTPEPARSHRGDQEADKDRGANLFIVGAPRSGTSYLHARLAAHPEIFAPPVKETHHHIADRWPIGGPEREAFTTPLAELLAGQRQSIWGGLVRDEETYLRLYAPGRAARWRLEGTPNYFAEGRPLAERIDAAAPGARVIVCLRDPVDRTLSHFRLFRHLGWEDAPFEAALAAGPPRRARGWAPTWDYLAYSRYADPLADWQAVFGDRLRVVHFDDLTFQPEATLGALAVWLDLSSDMPAAPSAGRNAAPSGEGGPTREAAEAIVAANGRIDIARERHTLAAQPRIAPGPPLVSIGMPVLNGAKTVTGALDSLRRQTYANIEIVVCDNASDDETAAVVEDIARQDPRVRLKRFDTRVHIQDSFRRALATARGPYFLFAPADDRWGADFLAAAVARMQADPDIAVCCGRIDLFDDAGRVYPSRGTQPFRGGARTRWRRALIDSHDASRIYGLLRTAMLDGIIPDTAPEGWDHYTAAKLALRGKVERVDTLAMTRHATPPDVYRARIRAQERTYLGRVFAMRHVARLFYADPEFPTLSPMADLAIWSFVGLRADFTQRGRWRNAPGRVLRQLAGLTARLARL